MYVLYMKIMLALIATSLAAIGWYYLWKILLEDQFYSVRAWFRRAR